MKLVKCNNGHFYDADKYSACPHCAEGGDEDDGLTVAMGGSHEKDVTVPFGGTAERDIPTTPLPVSLDDALSRTDNRTIPMSADEDDVKTVRLSAFSKGETEPVVGWLVGLNGEVYGESFPLVSGKNFIGRDKNMDVVLRGDNAVSRQKHAILIYEPKAKLFLAQPGESRELFYLNEEVVLNNQQLKWGDILCIGETKLMFVPLCGENFDWDKVKEEEKKNEQQ